MNEIQVLTGVEYVCVLVDNSKIKVFNSEKMNNKVSSITKMFAEIKTNDVNTQCKLGPLPYADLKISSSTRDKHITDKIIVSTYPNPFSSGYNLSEIDSGDTEVSQNS